MPTDIEMAEMRKEFSREFLILLSNQRREEDIRGITRSDYSDLAKQMEEKYSIKPIYSYGWYKETLFSSISYIDSFTGEPVSQEQIDLYIDQLKKADCKIIEMENTDEYLRVWFKP